MHLAVAAQVGHHGEVATTSLVLASVGFLSRMAVHVCLKRARAREALVADLALVLLLCARGDFRIKLPHH